MSNQEVSGNCSNNIFDDQFTNFQLWTLYLQIMMKMLNNQMGLREDVDQQGFISLTCSFRRFLRLLVICIVLSVEEECFLNYCKSYIKCIVMLASLFRLANK